MDTKRETLAPDLDKGEVLQRSYPLLGCIRLGCDRIGSNERVAQANRLVYAVDVLADQCGEPRCRLHLTIPHGGDPQTSIEVRIQPLTLGNDAAEQALVERMKARWSEVIAKGAAEGRWFAA
jgi:hypothetical protein